MDTAEFKDMLAREVKHWAKRTYDEWLELDPSLGEPLVYGRGKGKSSYDIEIALLEKEDEYVHVYIALHAEMPGSPHIVDFLVYRDGRVDLPLSLRPKP